MIFKFLFTKPALIRHWGPITIAKAMNENGCGTFSWKLSLKWRIDLGRRPIGPDTSSLYNHVLELDLRWSQHRRPAARVNFSYLFRYKIKIKIKIKESDQLCKVVELSIHPQSRSFERRICAQTQDLQIFKKFYMSEMNPKEAFHNTA